MKYILICLLLILPTSVFAWEWDWKDTALQATFLGAHTGNYYLVTKNIRKASKYDEYGMTEHPTTKEVSKYFWISGIAHTAVALALPKEYRTYWQMVGIGAEIGVSAYAVALGVNVKY